MTTHEIFVILNYLSVLIMMPCCIIIFKHRSSQMQKLALGTVIALTVANVGFLIRIESVDASGLIAGQKILYSFTPHAMFFMLLFILEYCNFKIPKLLRGAFHVLNLLISTMILTLNHHSLFYKSYWTVELQPGYVVLEKEYGVGHTITVAVFGLYMALALIASIEFTIRNRKRRGYIIRLMIAVMIPCLSYIIQKIIDTETDLQPVAFAIFSVLVIFMIYKDKLYDINNIIGEYSSKTLSEAIVVFDMHYHFKGCNEIAKNMFPFLENITLDSDVRMGEDNDFPSYLDGQITSYEKDDKYYKIEVRKIKEDGRDVGVAVWFDDVTLEHKYNEVLRAQKKSLESEVGRLTDITHIEEMTGLYNRRFYEEQLSKIREIGKPQGVVLAAMDLNDLKVTNDTLGHAAGDELIKSAAAIISSCFGEYGDCFRIGGDEFAVIMHSPEKSPKEFKEEFDAKVKAFKGRAVSHISIAYGLVEASEHPEMSIDNLVVLADKEMYLDKSRIKALKQ